MRLRPSPPAMRQPAPEPGRENFRRGKAIGLDLKQILLQYDKVGRLSDLDRSNHVAKPHRYRRIARIDLETGDEIVGRFGPQPARIPSPGISSRHHAFETEPGIG